jgi:hypothetical protein
MTIQSEGHLFVFMIGVSIIEENRRNVSNFFSENG